MNRINKKAKSKKKQIEGNTNIYKKCFLQICHSHRTDIAMEMLSDCIPILSDSSHWRKSHYNIMEEIQDHILNVKTIPNRTYINGSNNKKKSGEAYYGVTSL